MYLKSRNFIVYINNNSLINKKLFKEFGSR